MDTELLDNLTAKDKLYLRAALQVYVGELKKATKQNEKCELVVEAANSDAIQEYCNGLLMKKLQASIYRDQDPGLAGTPLGDAIDTDLVEHEEPTTGETIEVTAEVLIGAGDYTGQRRLTEGSAES